MLNLEGFMNIRDLKQKGWSVSAIASELQLDQTAKCHPKFTPKMPTPNPWTTRGRVTKLADWTVPPMDLIHPDGFDPAKFPVSQTPLDKPFHRPVHRFPTGLKDARCFPPAQPPCPAR